MVISASKRDVSGVYSVNGVNKNSNDGKAFLNKNACKGGTPPYKYYSYTTEVPKKTYFLGDTLRTTATRVVFVMEDKNLCEVDTFLQVNNLNKTLVTEVKLTQEISCYNASDGTLEVKVKSTNVSDMRYRWYKNNVLVANANQNILYNVGAGKYRSEVTDVETGMTSSYEITVTQPTQLKIAKETVTDNACHGERDGKISVTASGGTGSLLYTWADGVFGAERKYLPAGDYKLTVIDDNNCSVTKTYSIGQPQAPFEIVIDSVAPAVYGYNDQWQGGRIFSHAQGGTKPYNEPVVNSKKPENLAAGTHFLQQTDANNCEDYKMVKIEQIPMLSVSIIQTKYILCHGAAQGACRVNIEGGLAPYSIRWNNGEESIGIENLQAGDYTVSVTDKAGAVKQASFRLTEPPALSLQRIEAKNPDYYGCMGGVCTERTPNGFIELRVSGGTEPYTCTWKKDGAYLFDFDSCRADSLGGGIYQIDVSDKNGCQVQLVEVLESTPDLNARITETQSILCFGEAAGTLSATVEGGKKPYSCQWYRLDTDTARTFNWDSAENLIGSDAEISGLKAGFYGLKVTDKNGVVSKTVHTLTQKTPLVITLDSLRFPSYAGSMEGNVAQPLPDGFLHLHFSGGSAPYFYKWSDEDDLSEECVKTQRNGLAAGDYHLSVYDRNNCRVDTAFTLPHRENLRTRMWIEDSISCFGRGDGALGAGISGGVKPYSFVWKDENGDTVG
ncbi:MAG: SprB repeat-containing protein, partial [Bacteroidales bacterium]|nr:SprB repeat-containing protein [Bacteroidales bacterium]